MRGQRREGPQAEARRGEDRTGPERDILGVRGGVFQEGLAGGARSGALGIPRSQQAEPWLDFV